MRVLCVADVRGKMERRMWRIEMLRDVTGNLQSLNELAKQANANYIIHTGDFGFYDETSLERIAEKYDQRTKLEDMKRLTPGS